MTPNGIDAAKQISIIITHFPDNSNKPVQNKHSQSGNISVIVHLSSASLSDAY